MSDASAPRVAIVVRTKDRPIFLRRALRGIAAQTLTEWECVVVNDGGDAAQVDEVIAALSDAARGRIRAVHSPASRGRWTSANAGVLATTAPLIVLHDDDDSWAPTFLENAVEYLDAHPERDGVVSRIEIVWEEKAAEGYRETGREIFQPHLAELLLSDALLFNRFVPIGFVYRRRLHEELGLFDDALPVVGDWAFTLKVLARQPLEFLPGAPLAFWHQRSGVGGGNSVIDERDTHARYDARIRDDALREWVSREGLGLVLYLTKFIDRRFVDVENGIRHEVAESAPLRRMSVRAREVLARLRRR